MTKKAAASLPACDDDDTLEWADDQLDRAELAVRGKVVRAANGALARPGRPTLGAVAKRQVTLRLDPQVIDKLRASDPGWHGRINAALRKAAGFS